MFNALSRVDLDAPFEFFRFPFLQSHAEESKLRWLIKLRWLAVSLFVVFGAVGFFFHAIPLENISAYMGLTSVLVLFNLASQAYAYQSKRQVKPVEICFQLGFDLVMLALFLFYTHGIENPFVSLFYLNACLGGLLIPGYLSLPFVLLIHALLAFLQIRFLFSGVASSPELLLSIGVSHVLVFGFWLVMRSLGYYFERQREKQMIDRLLLEKQDRLRALGALSAGFSHEFASPLNTAKLRIQRLMRADSTSEDVREAHFAIEACEAVIRQMNASQVDARSFSFSRVSLDGLLNELLEAWRKEHPDAKIEKNFESFEKVDLPTIAFAQVILNLLDNAYEANSTGVIRVLLKRLQHEVLLSVEDGGPGFSKEVLNQLGEPFVTTKEQGTGLGLYVSDLFVQSMGGELQIRNLDVGARVMLKWPCSGDLNE